MGLLVVYRAGQADVKNPRSRVVTIPPPAQLALRSVPTHPSGLLFTSPRDCMWRQHTQYRYWALLRKLADRPGLAFYELRHAAATMLLERGVTPGT
jgi:integrase